MKFVSSSTRETKKFAENLAKEVRQAESRKKAMVFGLQGDLGSGKTTFVQGFARGLGIKEKILSPTFVILKSYGSFFHIDCYRIESSRELQRSS